MYLRLILLLTIMGISNMVVAQNVMTPADGDYIYNPAALPGSLTNPVPADGVIQKWVHDTSQKGSITWAQDDFKAYRWGNISFRLRFPNNYDASQKYPLILFMQGAGQSAFISDPTGHNTATVNRENQDQLWWGAQLFRDSIKKGSLNAFLLFPQLSADDNYSGAQWDQNTINPLNNILDTLEKYNGLDPDRVIAMGVSAGGFGCVKYASLYPKRIAAVISASPAFIANILSNTNDFVHIPIYITAGGIDTRPQPIEVIRVRDSIAALGGDVYLGYYPTSGHETWNMQWQQKDVFNRLLLTAYWNRASKAQPLLYYQNDTFCEGQPINAKMGITAGFFAYEWQRDAGSGFTTIAGAVSNTYTATQVGQYRVRFKRTAAYNWSVWTPNPIVISTKACALADTAFAEHFETTPINPYVTFSGGPGGGNAPYFKNNTDCQNGLFVNGTQVFTQDASGRQGGKFMLNNTTDSGCNYNAGDQVWRTYLPATVTPNTDYTLNFYMANQAADQNTDPTSTVTALVPVINHMPLSPVGVEAVGVGHFSWKKYSFNWNSGNNNSAEIAIINNTATGKGNDFALDEISLVKSTPAPMPGGALKNVHLWSKGNSIVGFDGSPVGMWPNSDINGNSLMQPLNSSQPLFQNEGTENINFNPVTAFLPQTNKFMTVPGGFAGTASHTAVYAYMVLRTIATDQHATYLREGGAGGKLVMAQSTGTVMKWNGGEDSSDIIATPVNSIDLKPTVWSFSKSTVATPSGNKRDIRKNGVVLASSSTATPFTGNHSNLYLSAFQFLSNVYLGAYGGDIAEIVYVMDSTMTANRQNNIESYLAIKYGTTLGNKTTPVSYTASDSSICWPADAHFQTDVFGIGTDSASALVQTISNSVNTGTGNGSGQPAKGNLVLSSPAILRDKQFLMIGNDSIAPTQSVIPAGGSSIAAGSTRINRSWKVANTGGVGAVNLSFDTTGLGAQQGGVVISNYSLMIDNDGDGNFNTGTLSFFTATGAAGKRINFNGVTLKNGVVFTILTFKMATALPAVWLGFTAAAINGNGQLKWQTSDEINVDRYLVEHSFNGVSYSVIGNVPANNNPGTNNYSFTDNGLTAGIHYYRIRRVDKDGNSSLSGVQSVSMAASGANVQVIPNPVTGPALVLAIAVQQNIRAMLQVVAADGKLVLQQFVNLNTGRNLVNLDISHIPFGTYMVRVQLKDGPVTRKFIRQQ